jgi:DNA-directed RNA polymerase specialized sigma24 family protein
MKHNYLFDEDLKLEDLAPDIDVSTPELRNVVRMILNEAPLTWRRGLLFHDIMGRSDAVVGKAIGVPEAEVGRVLERAREHLRRRLADHGYGRKRAA